MKNFETYQEIVSDILDAAWDRVKEARKLTKTTKRMEWTFPALAQEDRTAKIKDIAFAESMDYFTKERAATMAAKEFGVSEYHYDAERKAIDTEREEEPVISATMQQVPKIMEQPGMGEEPGLGQDMMPGRRVRSRPVSCRRARRGRKARRCRPASSRRANRRSPR